MIKSGKQILTLSIKSLYQEEEIRLPIIEHLTLLQNDLFNKTFKSLKKQIVLPENITNFSWKNNLSEIEQLSPFYSMMNWIYQSLEENTGILIPPFTILDNEAIHSSLTNVPESPVKQIIITSGLMSYFQLIGTLIMDILYHPKTDSVVLIKSRIDKRINDLEDRIKEILTKVSEGKVFSVSSYLPDESSMKRTTELIKVMETFIAAFEYYHFQLSFLDKKYSSQFLNIMNKDRSLQYCTISAIFLTAQSFLKQYPFPRDLISIGIFSACFSLDLVNKKYLIKEDLSPLNDFLEAYNPSILLKNYQSIYDAIYYIFSQFWNLS